MIARTPPWHVEDPSLASTGYAAGSSPERLLGALSRPHTAGVTSSLPSRLHPAGRDPNGQVPDPQSMSVEPGRWPCERFTRAGERCRNRTDNSDRWCRATDCPGYQRARADIAPDIQSGYFGTSRHVAATSDVPAGLDVDETGDVSVTQRAIDSFRYHHGGSGQAASAQLLTMLEDFLLRSARLVTERGYLRLAAQGYELVLAPDRLAVVSYKTVHRERTWEQVKAGVTSRYGTKPFSDYPAYVEQDRDPVPNGRVRQSIDAGTIRLTRRAMQNWSRIIRERQGRTGMPALDIETDLRAALATATVGEERTQPDSGMHEIVHDGLTWLITPDCSVVIGTRTLTLPNPAADTPNSLKQA